MAEQSFPFENIDTTEAQFSKWARNFQDTGVQGAPTGTELKVTASGTTMIVDVAIGQVFIQGHYYINTASKPLTVTSAGTNTRIDYIVAELDTTANTITTKIVEGIAVSSSPVAPTLTQTDSLYQFPLALLTIPTSSAVINNAMLTDKRVFMSARVGIWTTANRPASPLTNQTLGYNTTLSYHEFWNGSAWVQLAPPVDLTTVIPKSVLTTAGDLIVASGASTPARLGIGAADTVLKSNGTTASWGTIATAGPTALPTTSFIEAAKSTGSYDYTGLAAGNYYMISGDGTLATTISAGNIKVSTTTFNSGSVSTNYLVNTVTAGTTLKVIAKPVNSITNLHPSDIPGTYGAGYVGKCGTAIFAYTFSGTSYVLKRTTNSGASWTTVLNTGTTYNVTRVVWNGSNNYVAITGGSTYYTSSDGVTWTTRTSPLTTSFYTTETIEYGDGMFMLGATNSVNPNGFIYSSTDAISWTQRYTYSADSRFATFRIAHNGLTGSASRWVAMPGMGSNQNGGSGTPATSTNGTTWTLQSSMNGGNTKSMVFSNGLFVVCEGWQQNGSMVNQSIARTLRTSPDGITWTTRQLPSLVTNLTGITSLIIDNNNPQNMSASTNTHWGIYANGKWYIQIGVYVAGAGTRTITISTTDWTTYAYEFHGGFANDLPESLTQNQLFGNMPFVDGNYIYAMSQRTNTATNDGVVKWLAYTDAITYTAKN